MRAWCRRWRRASPAKRSPRTVARSTPGASRAELIDATPIGINVRSTVATYTGIHAGLRYMAMAVWPAKRHAADIRYDEFHALSRSQHSPRRAAFVGVF